MKEVLATDGGHFEVDLGQGHERSDRAWTGVSQRKVAQTLSKNVSFFDPEDGESPRAKEGGRQENFYM